MAFPVRFAARGQAVQTTARELGEDGIEVLCVEPPQPGERVSLRLYLPALPARDLAAEVTQAGADRFHARFVELAPDMQRALEQAVKAGAWNAQVEAEPLPGGENRRALPRYLDRFRLTLSMGQHRSQREALNVSASGLFIETDGPPALEEIVQVVLELPDGQPPAEAQAIVVRRVVPGEAQAPGAAVQFIGADDAFRARLDAFLKRLRDR